MPSDREHAERLLVDCMMWDVGAPPDLDPVDVLRLARFAVRRDDDANELADAAARRLATANRETLAAIHAAPADPNATTVVALEDIRRNRARKD